jgi:hypothetical protein
MKGLIFLIICALFVGTGLYAQRGGRGKVQRTPEERATMAIQQLAATVEMNDEQKTKITEIYKNFFAESQPFREERNQAKVIELASARDLKVKTVLNDETKYKTYLKYVTEKQSRALQNSKQLKNQTGGRAGNQNSNRSKNCRKASS